MQELRIEAQQAADELFIERRLRFELTVNRIKSQALADRYTIEDPGKRMEHPRNE